jgi:hypothetical protein
VDDLELGKSGHQVPEPCCRYARAGAEAQCREILVLVLVNNMAYEIGEVDESCLLVVPRSSTAASVWSM